MAEAEGIPPTASVAVPGLSLNYLGNWAYAASGEVSSTDAPPLSTCLDFTSGVGLIVANVEFLHTVITGENIDFEIAFNDNVILSFQADGTPNQQPHTYKILIPPFTHVVIKWGCDTVTKDGTVFLSGRVYGV